MQRAIATQKLRNLLDEQLLTHWHIRLTTDITKGFLGLCDYKTQTIVLNAHHIDTHPDEEVINTIRHEVAHALTEGHGHDEIWAAKARELGCDNTLPCASYSLSPAAIDAIRSGADLEVTFDEHVIRTPKFTVHKVQEKCPTCGRVAKTKSQTELKTSVGRVLLRILECGHTIIANADSTSHFEDITFDGDENCAHVWGTGKYYSYCQKCPARRLYPFQVEAARKLEASNGKFGIFDEQGLGKTIDASAYLKFHKNDAWPFLWLGKSAILFQYARELVRVCGIEAMPQIITNGKQQIIPNFNCIASYDILRRVDLSKLIGYKTIILDECQAIKNPDSTRTQCVRKLVKSIPNVKVIALSGTPWKNRASEFFVALNLLDPMMFPSFQGFKDRYVASHWDGNKYVEGGFRNPQKFRETISHIAIRRERKEVLPDLPSVNRTRLLCELPDYTKKVYKEEEDKLVKIFNSHVIDGTEDSFDSQSSIMQSLIVMRQIIGIAKVPTTVEFAQEFLEETDRKLVIFVHHIKCGEMIYEQMKAWCKENNVPEPLKITASMNPIERSDVAVAFNGPHYRLLIASTLASGEGLNLQTCSDCIMHERQWNPANEEQAEGRFARIGQEEDTITATYVHAADTVDPTLDAIVERKRIAFHEAMNKGEMPMWNEKDVLKELVASIVKNRKGKK